MSNARIDIEVGDLYISLEGSESFVKEQYALITSQLGLFGTQTRESAKKEIATIEAGVEEASKPEPKIAEPAKVEKVKKTAKTESPAAKKEVKQTQKTAEEPLAPSAALTEAIKAKSRRVAKKPAAPASKPAAKATKSTKLPKDFKEWIKMVSGKLNKTDLALLSGFYVQLNSDKQAFRVREASKILRNNGFDLSNASIFIRNNLKSGKLFENSKVGSEAYYRLTDKGLERVKKLLGM